MSVSPWTQVIARIAATGDDTAENDQLADDTAPAALALHAGIAAAEAALAAAEAAVAAAQSGSTSEQQPGCEGSLTSEHPGGVAAGKDGARQGKGKAVDTSAVAGVAGGDGGGEGGGGGGGEGGGRGEGEGGGGGGGGSSSSADAAKITAGDGDAAVWPLHLFCRMEGAAYVYCGRLRLIEHLHRAPPMKFMVGTYARHNQHSFKPRRPS
jgi:hypothetical protein